MTFDKLTECPFCHHGEFYTTQYVCGTIRYHERFDGEEAENAELYDGLNIKKSSSRAYCCHCNKYLGDTKTNAISHEIEKLLSKK